ncbi:MAG: hypothetical protein M0002_08080 [Rhodospirillales bacterium]|nr:hypothetical protein [Rhodospirillales bacterium]
MRKTRWLVALAAAAVAWSVAEGPSSFAQAVGALQAPNNLSEIAAGGTTAESAARVNLGAAARGANGDITSLTGLTTALPIGEGGTGATTASAALAAIGGIGAGTMIPTTTASAVSAAGTTQGTATSLTAQDNEVGSVTAGSGVIVPAADLGDWITVVNEGANSLLVYPPSGAQWNALGSNVAGVVVAGGVAQFKLFSATQGYTR